MIMTNEAIIHSTSNLVESTTHHTNHVRRGLSFNPHRKTYSDAGSQEVLKKVKDFSA